MTTPKAGSIDEYIRSFPGHVQEKLKQIRLAIRKAAPGAEETIKYAMPTFVWHGNLVHFAAYKSHIALYPAPREAEAFKTELAGYKGSKGTVQFPLDKPIPLSLVTRIVKYRVKTLEKSSGTKPGKSARLPEKRKNDIELSKAEFKKIGHQLIELVGDFLDTVRQRPVTPPAQAGPLALREIIGNSSLPAKGTKPGKLLYRAADLLFNHSLLNGHPKFYGYITSSPAPIGALADLLAAAVNPNIGAQILSPIATEIERQTIRWLAEFIGVSPEYGGILVSGGNMANFTAFVAARTVKAPATIKTDGISNAELKPRIYCSKATHSWIEKAAIIFGLGTGSIRWIETDLSNRMDIGALENSIKSDLQDGCTPIMVIGNAGDVSTGVVDDLHAIAGVCKTYGLWFHVDGAYGIPAAVVPGMKQLFRGIESADSIALDPHKWLYSPLEAGCTLVRNPAHLLETYSSNPVYYNFSSTDDVPAHNFYEYGLQNSRGFRALKVWLGLQHLGKAGYIKLIAEDIELSKQLFEQADAHPELEAITQNLSIATLRYNPFLQGGSEPYSFYLNDLNEALLNLLQKGGEVFLSNAVVMEKYCLRACIVNFRTSARDIPQVIRTIVKKGRQVHESLLKSQAGSVEA